MPLIRVNPRTTKLTPRQEQAISALSECLSVREASKKTGIPASTIRSWLQQAHFLLAAEQAGYTSMNIFAKKKGLSPEQVREFEKQLDQNIANWKSEQRK